MASLTRPLLLAPDNFTPRERTPWGGTRIADRYKTDVPGVTAGTVVGESWEISVEPDFPGRLEDGSLLAAVLAADPSAALGREAVAGRTGTALLVKLLDAADELSVQIHPSESYAGLGPDESGKPEAWYVVEREPGSGLYLGLRDGVSSERMEHALASGEDVSKLLFFVEVEPGDFFSIEAGTAHAIGRGVTLVEPQHVVPGRRGVTYRYWDWNRRYDPDGRPDPDGAPRALHVEDALDVTAWDDAREDELLSRIRVRGGAPPLDGAATFEELCGPGAPVKSEALVVGRLFGTGELEIPNEESLRGFTVLAGTLALEAGGARVVVQKGRSALLPAAAAGARAHLDACHAVVSSVWCGA